MAPKTKTSWLGMLKTFKIIGFHHIWSKKNSIPHMCNFPLSDVLKHARPPGIDDLPVISKKYE